MYMFHRHHGCLHFLGVLFTLLHSPLLLAVAGVYFDPDVYIMNEGNNVTLILRTNVTVNKRFGVLVNTVDDSAISMYCMDTAILTCFNYCSYYLRSCMASDACPPHGK